MPALLSWPGHLPQNEIRSQIAYGCDWYVTLAELCGSRLPSILLDGKSLVPLIRSTAALPSPHEALHWQFGSGWAVRSGDWKLLVDAIDTTKSSPGEPIKGAFLVNLRDDPSERANLAATHPEIVARLSNLHAEWESGLPRQAKP